MILNSLVFFVFFTFPLKCCAKCKTFEEIENILTKGIVLSSCILEEINDLGDNTKFMKSIFVFGGEYDMIKIYFKGSISSKRLGE